jgi:hypothetical protein
MALILNDFLIRKRDDSLPVGSSGFFVRIPSVFLFILSDGAKVRGELKQGKEEQEITLILEKGSCEDLLHICAGDWDDNFTEGRTDLKLTESLQNGKRTLIYDKSDVVTSPAQSCRISSKT